MEAYAAEDIAMGRHAEDLTGQVFGRLSVVERGPNRAHGGGKPSWICQCECGVLVAIPAARLKGGSNKSCGCFRRDRAGGLYRSHGKSKTAPYTMFYDARKRALKLGLPFDIEPDDIQIPEICPALGIPLDGKTRDRTPSLDRVIPKNGYVPGNICVISFRANRFKNDASIEEIKAVLSYIEERI